MDTVNIGTISENERLLFSQFRRKINAEAARAQVKKLEYNLADIAVGLNALKTACADANALEIGGICVLPCYIRQCSGFLGFNRKSLLIGCISYPYGGDTTAIKVKAVKRAIADGADEVEVAVPVSHVRDGNYAYVKREFKKLKKACKNKALRIDAECNMLTENELIKLCTIAAECGVNSVKTQSVSSALGSEAKLISKIKSAVKDRCTIKAEGVATILEMSSAIDAGANVIGSKNATSVARAIISSAETTANI